MTVSLSSVSGIHGAVLAFITDNGPISRRPIVDEFHKGQTRALKTTKSRLNGWLHELATDGWIEVDNGRWFATPKGEAEHVAHKLAKAERESVLDIETLIGPKLQTTGDIIWLDNLSEVEKEIHRRAVARAWQMTGINMKAGN